MVDRVLNFYKEELLDEKLPAAERVTNMRRVKVVGSSLTLDAIKGPLVGLIQEARDTWATEDEFQYTLAGSIPTLITFFDQAEEQLSCFLPVLESLASVAEPAVRKQAVSSIIKIVEAIPDALRKEFVLKHIIPLIEKLTRQGGFPARVSVCDLFVTAYSYAPETFHHDLRRQYMALCHDDAPMVKRAAAEILKDLFRAINQTDVLLRMGCSSDANESILQFFWNEQTHEAVRCSAVEATVVLAGKLPATDSTPMLTPRISSIVRDRSWRVRLTLAHNIDELLKSFNAPESRAKYLATVISDLLGDLEPEVRAATVTRIAENPKALTSHQLETYLFADMAALANDASQVVRAALAKCVRVMAQRSTPKQIEKYLLPLIEKLLKDEHYAVRLNVLPFVGDSVSALGTELIAKSLLPTLQSLVSDPQWRIRYAVVEQMPKLALEFGLDSFTTALQPLYFAALTDNVYAVRHCAMECAMMLTTMFGSQWMTSKFLPEILEQGTGSREGFAPFQSRGGLSPSRRAKLTGRGKPVSYLSRIAVLRTLQYLAASPAVKVSVVEEVLVPHIVAALNDHVSNVRLVALKTVSGLLGKNRITIQCFKQNFEPILSTLSNDEDLDVRYTSAKLHSLAYEDLDVEVYATAATYKSPQDSPDGAAA